MDQNLYNVLGVPRDATLNAIRQTYRSKAVRLHPDKGGDPAEFAALQDAYAILSNTVKRKHYDATGRTELSAEESLRSAMQGSEGKPQGTKSPSSEFSPQNRKSTPEPVQVVAPASPASRPKARTKVPSPKKVATGGPVAVPAKFERPVPHVTVAGFATRTLSLDSLYPNIKDSSIGHDSVLVQMRAIPLSFADLNVEGRFAVGDFYGMHGIGQVLVAGGSVDNLSVGDWVVPLLEVDEDGDVVDDAPPPATGRMVAELVARRCARVGYRSDTGLNLTQLALAKSIGAASRMVEQFAGALPENTSVILNCANSSVGLVLMQMLTVLNFRVFAVVRDHVGSEGTKKRLEALGAARALLDDDNIRESIEQMQVPLPQLAFDGVGGESTARIGSCLTKTGDIVCFGLVGGEKRQVLPNGWGKKFKGDVHHFSLDEWLQEDLEEHSAKLDAMLVQASRLLLAGRLKLDIASYEINEFDAAVELAQTQGRCQPVVVTFPERLEEEEVAAASESVPATTQPEELAQPSPVVAAGVAPAASEGVQHPGSCKSWDLDFLEWDAMEEELEQRKELESNLFKPDPVMEEMRIQPYVDDTLAMPVAIELGAKKGEASAVLFWLPGANEVPEEHGAWLSKLTSAHPGLRTLILKPKVGFKWFDQSDNDGVKMGLTFGIVDDDFERNMEGDFLKSTGDIAFPAIGAAEAEALQQVETAALGLARRAVIEEKALIDSGMLEQRPEYLPFFFGGFSQGGSVALYTAICLMATPVLGVAFCHSGVPCGAMLGKRLSERARQYTKLYAVFDRDDKEVPSVFAEAITRMFELLDADITLTWLTSGDGHDFFDDAAEKTSKCISQCFYEDDEENQPPAAAGNPGKAGTRSPWGASVPVGWLQKPGKR